MAEGDVWTFGGDTPPPAQDTSWLGDQYRTVKAGFLDAAASSMGLLDLVADSDWANDNREWLKGLVDETRKGIAPERLRDMQSEFFKEPGSQNASFWENPISSAWYKSLNMLGSTVPSIATRLAGAAAGGAYGGPALALAVGAATEGAMSAGDVYGDIKDQISKMTPDQLSKAGSYADDIAMGYTDAEARGLLARDMAKYALTAGVISTVLGAAGERGGGAAAGRIFRKDVVEQGGNLGQRAVTGFKREGGQELGQTVGEVGARAGAFEALTGELPSWQSVGNQLTEGYLGGGVLGAGAQAAFGKRQTAIPVPGNAPDPAQTAALTTATTPPPTAGAPAEIVDPPSGPSIDDIPTGAPGLIGAPVQLGRTFEDPGAAPGSDASYPDLGLSGPAAYTPPGMGAPAGPQTAIPMPPGAAGPLDQSNGDVIARAQQSIAALPVEAQTELQRLYETFKVAPPAQKPG